MVELSAVLYFLNHHFILAMPVIWVACAIVASTLAAWSKNKAWYGLAIIGMVAGILNPFFGSTVNGRFLNAYGTYGTAVLTHSEQTNSQLNDQYIDAYEGVMRTADGRDVKIEFDTMSATLYPWRNEINIPPIGDTFVVKYIPGFERNIVILRDESPYGKRILMRQARQPLDRARALLKASPGNETFRQEYIAAAQRFLAQYGEEADESLVRQLKEDIAHPETAGMPPQAARPEEIPEPDPPADEPKVPVVPRTIETLANDGPDACFRAIAQHFGAGVKVHEIVSFFSPGADIDSHASRPAGEMTTCVVEYQNPDNPLRLLRTSLNLRSGEFHEPEPIEARPARGNPADFRLDDILIPLSSVHPAALTTLMEAQKARLSRVYSQYVWSGIRLEAPDVFRPTHTLRIDLDGRLAVNEIRDSGYASVTVDGQKITRDHLMP